MTTTHGSFRRATYLSTCELAYQALEQKAKLSGHASYSTPNYDVWKQRGVYTILEFASLLDNSDPESGSFSSSKEALIKLLKEHATQGKLKYIVETGSNFEGHVFQKKVSRETKIERDEAIRWAETMSFNVSKIK
jgi:hypothetical protein